MTKKLGPVRIELTIDDCGECPFIEEDESFACCSYKDGPILSVYRREGQTRLPPAKCPFRHKRTARQAVSDAIASEIEISISQEEPDSTKAQNVKEE